MVHIKKINTRKFQLDFDIKYECSQYVDELLRRKDNDRVKVITGLRRRGMIITPMAECHLYGHLKHTRREVLI